MCEACHVYFLDRIPIVGLLTLNSTKEHPHFLCFFLLNFLHAIQVHKWWTKVRIEDWVAAEDQLDPRLEGELIQTEVSEECGHGELHNSFHFVIGEDKDLERWSVNRVVLQMLLQHFQTNLWFQLLLEHASEDMIKNGQHGGHFFIAEAILLAEEVVHVVEV